MNFFGHAAVAAWRSPAPGFVLGAMLPDFATMIGVRPPAVAGSPLSEGVAFHHATDRVFHGSAVFGELERSARSELRACGLHRGATLAVAHVGTELLLDVVLARDEAAREAYLSALDYAADEDGRAPIEWACLEHAARYEQLCTVLLARGISQDAAAPWLIAERLERALAHRPRLALRPGDGRAVSAWLAVAAARVEARAAALFDEIRAGLALSFPR